MSESTRELSLSHFTPDAKALVSGAQGLADQRRHADVLPIHLLAVALRDRGIAAVFQRAGAEPQKVASLADAALGRIAATAKEPASLSPALLELLSRAEREAQREQQKLVTVEATLVALSQEIRGAAGEVLGQVGLAPGSLRAHLGAYAELREPSPPAPRGGGDAAQQPEGLVRDLVALATTFDPVLGRAAEERRLMQMLERRAHHHVLVVGEPGVGKTSLVRALAQRIASGDVPEALAKTRLLELDVGAALAGPRLRGEVEERLRALVRNITRDDDDDVLVIESLDELIFPGAASASVADVLRSTLDRSSLRVLATATTEGKAKLLDKEPGLVRRLSVLELEAPTPAAATEIVRGAVPRFERHHGVRVSERATTTAVRLAVRYLGDRALPESALLLLDEASALRRVESDGLPAATDSLVRRLDSLRAQRIAVADARESDAEAIRAKIDRELASLAPEVERARARLEARKGKTLALRTLEGELRGAEAELERVKGSIPARAAELEYVVLPDLRARLSKAETALADEGPREARVVTEDDVARVLEGWTGIQVSRMLEGDAERLLHLDTRLSARVVGQPEAVSALARAVRRGRVGLRDPGRPIGSFLFLGPSGVGKTELAKAVAEVLFDDERSLTRLDMSEFMERHMAQRLLGAPPGYADSEQGGFLTEAVRRRPSSVLLFDEIEKAHNDVFNLLLQVLDDGRLTDGRGRLADFSSTVVVMTSNIGSARILDAEPRLFETDDGREALRDVLMGELRGSFRPELLNRIDEVIVFRPLGKRELQGILSIQLTKLEQQLEPRGISLELTEAARELLVDESYEPAFGARPLRRTIARTLSDPLADAILKVPEGKRRLLCDAKDGRLTLVPSP